MPSPPATQMRTFHLDAPLPLVHDSNIGLVDVSCTEARGGTDVFVRYTLTAVSEAGESFVAQFLAEEHYTRMIEEWQAATRKALDGR
ncbi:MAG: hypothetical protein ACJ8R9_08250 [Steroidobacteraceae bacterium]